jgi:DNA-binding transcriptional regulator YbjK
MRASTTDGEQSPEEDTGLSRPRAIARRKESRADGTAGLLAEAVIVVVAEVGVSRLTHRRVAAAAGVSLSATTYHYKTKADMLATAAQRLLDGYIRDFKSIARDCRQGLRPSLTLAELCFRIVRNAADRNSVASLAWCEIMLDAARSPEGHEIAQRWFADLQGAWEDVAHAFEEDATALELLCMIDLVVGLLFVSRGLQLDENAIAAVENGASPEATWRLAMAPAAGEPGGEKPRSRKSAETRERLLRAAIGLLIEGGTGAVTYAAVAERTGDAMTAPAYHFSSISGLLKAAETRMFRDSKDRAREVFASGQSDCHSAEELADVTAAIFIREATQFRPQSIAHYSIWLEAARNPQLRPDVSTAVGDQLRAWMRRLAPISGGGEHNALACQALFVGALVRVVSTGARTEALARIRAQFEWMFGLASARHENSTLFQKLLRRRAPNA